ncbi:hypothetical protein SOMG_04159 [Schizosaccharomyces osmophilus]|uniref:Mug135-like C-terminal domain-containing protein n=1 Tax=Schizosaccharomyces osmophilus TaxID=2545709 RepID=A0AAE9WFJ3_9SCHI|nr:uncharacterized protein SOMG_04159 [Schizosaccharomyces osmophilus]WBW74965.1 hypothetical protein SOMG_04159 [Schizosaccharomyces osmophilus]
MTQDLFDNASGIPPPSDDSYAEQRFTNESTDAISQDPFNSFRSKMAILNKAVTARLEEGGFSQDDVSDIRQMLQELTEGQTSLQEEMIQAQNSLREEQDRLKGRLEGQYEVVETNYRASMDDIVKSIDQSDSKINKTKSSVQRTENFLNRYFASDTKPIPFIDGRDPPSWLPKLIAISDIDNLNPNQLKTYLEGYGGTYDEKESQTSLKRNLADYVGFITPHDNRYEFSESNEPFPKYMT